MCAAEPVSELNEAEFHGIADDLLEDLEGRLDALDDFLDDAELTNSVSQRSEGHPRLGSNALQTWAR